MTHSPRTRPGEALLRGSVAGPQLSLRRENSWQPTHTPPHSFTMCAVLSVFGGPAAGSRRPRQNYRGDLFVADFEVSEGVACSVNQLLHAEVSASSDLTEPTRSPLPV